MQQGCAWLREDTQAITSALALIKQKCPAAEVLHLGAILLPEQYDDMKVAYEESGRQQVSIPNELGVLKEDGKSDIVLESLHDYKSDTKGVHETFHKRVDALCPLSSV